MLLAVFPNPSLSCLVVAALNNACQGRYRSRIDRIDKRRRIGWTFVNAHTMITENGKALCARVDSPAAVTKEVYKSVRRWRLGQLIKDMPSLRPSFSVDGNRAPPTQCPPRGYDSACRVPVDWHDAPWLLSKLLHSRNNSIKSVPEWNYGHRQSLTSAVTNGQWPQARRATVAAWKADPRCQLCVSAPGTLEHRRICTATTPAHGWTQADSRLSAFIGGLDPARRRMLQTRALLAISIPMQPVLQEPLFRWLSTEPDVTSAEYTWYTDGPSSTHIRRSAWLRRARLLSVIGVGL